MGIISKAKSVVKKVIDKVRPPAPTTTTTTTITSPPAKSINLTSPPTSKFVPQGKSTPSTSTTTTTTPTKTTTGGSKPDPNKTIISNKGVQVGTTTYIGNTIVPGTGKTANQLTMDVKRQALASGTPSNQLARVVGTITRTPGTTTTTSTKSTTSTSSGKTFFGSPSTFSESGNYITPQGGVSYQAKNGININSPTIPNASAGLSLSGSTYQVPPKPEVGVAAFWTDIGGRKVVENANSIYQNIKTQISGQTPYIARDILGGQGGVDIARGLKDKYQSGGDYVVSKTGAVETKVKEYFKSPERKQVERMEKQAYDSYNAAVNGLNNQITNLEKVTDPNEYNKQVESIQQQQIYYDARLKNQLRYIDAKKTQVSQGGAEFLSGALTGVASAPTQTISFVTGVATRPIKTASDSIVGIANLPKQIVADPLYATGSIVGGVAAQYYIWKGIGKLTEAPKIKVSSRTVTPLGQRGKGELIIKQSSENANIVNLKATTKLGGMKKVTYTETPSLWNLWEETSKSVNVPIKQRVTVSGTFNIGGDKIRLVTGTGTKKVTTISGTPELVGGIEGTAKLKPYIQTRQDLITLSGRGTLSKSNLLGTGDIAKGGKLSGGTKYVSTDTGTVTELKYVSKRGERYITAIDKPKETSAFVGTGEAKSKGITSIRLYQDKAQVQRLVRGKTSEATGAGYSYPTSMKFVEGKNVIGDEIITQITGGELRGFAKTKAGRITPLGFKTTSLFETKAPTSGGGKSGYPSGGDTRGTPGFGGDDMFGQMFAAQKYNLMRQRIEALNPSFLSTFAPGRTGIINYGTRNVVGLSTSSVILSGLSTASSLKSIPSTNQGIISRTIPISTQTPVSSSKTELSIRSITTPSTQQVTQQVTQQIIPPIIIPTTPRRIIEPIPKPKELIEIDPNNYNRKQPLQTGYNAYVEQPNSNGVLEKINRVAMSFKSAMAQVAERIDNTSAVKGKVVPMREKVPRVYDTGSQYLDVNRRKFDVQGNTKQGAVLFERKQYQQDSPSERRSTFGNRMKGGRFRL